jgi:hypothetical protein
MHGSTARTHVSTAHPCAHACAAIVGEPPRKGGTGDRSPMHTHTHSPPAAAMRPLCRCLQCRQQPARHPAFGPPPPAPPPPRQTTPRRRHTRGPAVPAGAHGGWRASAGRTPPPRPPPPRPPPPPLRPRARCPSRCRRQPRCAGRTDARRRRGPGGRRRAGGGPGSPLRPAWPEQVQSAAWRWTVAGGGQLHCAARPARARAHDHGCPARLATPGCPATAVTTAGRVWETAARGTQTGTPVGHRASGCRGASFGCCYRDRCCAHCAGCCYGGGFDCGCGCEWRSGSCSGLGPHSRYGRERGPGCDAANWTWSWTDSTWTATPRCPTTVQCSGPVDPGWCSSGVVAVWGMCVGITETR